MWTNHLYLIKQRLPINMSRPTKWSHILQNDSVLVMSCMDSKQNWFCYIYRENCYQFEYKVETQASFHILNSGESRIYENI